MYCYVPVVRMYTGCQTHGHSYDVEVRLHTRGKSRIQTRSQRILTRLSDETRHSVYDYRPPVPRLQIDRQKQCYGATFEIRKIEYTETSYHITCIFKVFFCCFFQQ